MSESDEVSINGEYLKTLMEMGIKEHIARKALIMSNNECLNTALMIALELNEELSEEDFEDSKMIFVVNSSLNMSVGKTAAQVAHAALNLYREVASPNYLQFSEVLSKWEHKGEKKVVLKGKDESEILELMVRAKDLSLPCVTIRDAGRTEIAPDSLTVFALFGLEECVNKVTGHLNLL
uniref:peptidyl-tRNA hydrolase n=1 Tax=Panstrongylus megistus TaxID=65343 RepID=A0A069DNR8_9HEMI